MQISTHKCSRLATAVCLHVWFFSEVTYDHLSFWAPTALESPLWNELLTPSVCFCIFTESSGLCILKIKYYKTGFIGFDICGLPCFYNQLRFDDPLSCTRHHWKCSYRLLAVTTVQESDLQGIDNTPRNIFQNDDVVTHSRFYVKTQETVFLFLKHICVVSKNQCRRGSIVGEDEVAEIELHVLILDTLVVNLRPCGVQRPPAQLHMKSLWPSGPCTVRGNSMRGEKEVWETSASFHCYFYLIHSHPPAPPFFSLVLSVFVVFSSVSFCSDHILSYLSSTASCAVCLSPLTLLLLFQPLFDSPVPPCLRSLD